MWNSDYSFSPVKEFEIARSVRGLVAAERELIVAIVQGVVVFELFVVESWMPIAQLLSGVAAAFQRKTGSNFLHSCSIPSAAIRLTPKMA